MISFKVRREYCAAGKLAGFALSPLLESEVLPRIGETVVGGSLLGSRHSHILAVTNVEHSLVAARNPTRESAKSDIQVVVRTDAAEGMGEVERALDELQEAGWQTENFQVDRDLW